MSPVPTFVSPLQAPAPPAAPASYEEAARLADVLLAAGRSAQAGPEGEHGVLRLLVLVRFAAERCAQDPEAVLGVLADFLAPGWRAHANPDDPDEAVDRWQDRAPRSLDVGGVLSLAAMHALRGGAW